MTNTPTRSSRVFLVLMLIATGITWGIGLLDFQYRGEAVLAFEEGFPGDVEKWIPAGDPANITLTPESIRIERHNDERSYAMRTFPLPERAGENGQQIRVQGVIQTLQPASPIDSKQVAAYMIWFQNKDNETIQYSTVQALTGDFKEYRAQKILSIPKNATAFVITLINRDSDGSFELTDARVSLVSTTLLYQAVSYCIFGLWAILFLIACIWLFKRATPILALSLGLLIALTIVGVLLPESITTQYVNPLYQKLASIVSSEPAKPLGLLYKSGHFLFFFLGAFIMMLNRHHLRISAWMVLSYLLVFALATEGLQLYLFNRSTRLTDIIIDIAGVMLAWLLAHAIEKFVKNSGRVTTD